MWYNSPLDPKFEVNLETVLKKVDLETVFKKIKQEFKDELKNKQKEIADVTYPYLCSYFNIPIDFTKKDLDSAYRKLLVKYYPDNPNGNIDKFDEVKRKYKELIEIIHNPAMEEYGITQR